MTDSTAQAQIAVVKPALDLPPRRRDGAEPRAS